jgi:serralysin
MGSGTVASVATAYSIIGQHDFDGDGKADLLWRDSSGNLYMWFMNGSTMISSATVGNVPPAWSVIGTGDMNGDGKGDILWQDSSGNVAVWFMNGSNVMFTTTLGGVDPAVWGIAATDSVGDIFWRDSSGNLAVWRITGGGLASTVSLGNVPLNWQIAGIGDFNADNNPDILFRDSNTGTLAIWFLNSSAQVQSTATVGAVPTSSTWRIAQLGDYAGTSFSDILWIDGSGNMAIWFMNGATIASSANLGNVGTSWSVQGMNAE